MNAEVMRTSKIKTLLPWIILSIVIGAIVSQLVMTYIMYRNLKPVIKETREMSQMQNKLLERIEKINRDISSLETNVATTIEGLNDLEKQIFGEVDKEPVPDTDTDPSDTDAIFIADGRVVIPYFSQYWSDLSPVSSAHIFESRNDITVDRRSSKLLITTDFVRDGGGHHVEIELYPDGSIRYKGANQYEAEVIMQRLLDNVLQDQGGEINE